MMPTIHKARTTRTAKVLLTAVLMLAAACSKTREAETAGSVASAPADPFPFSHHPDRLEKVGPESCRECHEEEFEDWSGSHHAKANRPVDLALDLPAFGEDRTVRESGVTYRMVEKDGSLVLRVEAGDGTVEEHTMPGVIGYTPLRQYLAEFPGGRFQTASASYEVPTDSWFDVFAGEDRMPGEWGHWTGQGMNWNSNCAYCHTTEFHKNFDLASDSYHTEWLHQGIGCLECHSGMDTHVKAAAMGDNQAGITQWSRHNRMDNCMTCHSRRDQLTADAFEVGDAFADHFSLAVLDQPGLYYPDGQILDEVFVATSFRMSRMAHAGVTCFDCHDGHTLELILPAENNMLCMRCHENGLPVGENLVKSPIINPVEHGNHAEGSAGNRCVECHMPKTPYMQVDPRADHGFHVPDPLMTRELGIPNACARCHSEEDGEGLDWQIEWAEKWYGDKLAEHRQRRRARAIAAAYNFQPEAADALLELASDEDIPVWRATYAGLLNRFAGLPDVLAFLQASLKDDEPLVREHALGSLTFLPESGDLVRAALDDPSRSVRIAAARALMARNEVIPEGRAKQEWQAYLEFNSDRPQSLFIMAQDAAKAGDRGQVRKLVDRGIKMDRLNPEVYREAAIIMSATGDLSAPETYLKKGWDMAPDNAAFPYLLGLLRAEQNNLAETLSYLQEAVAIDPEFYRAWYNLALTYFQLDRIDDAARAIARAAPGMQGDPSWQQAAIAIQRRMASPAPQNRP